MIRSACLALTFGLTASFAHAEVRPETANLLDVLAVTDLMEVMREEGTRYGADLEEQLFPGQGGSAWSAMVAQVYDPDIMYRAFSTRFDQELTIDEITVVTEFFSSGRGQQITDLEVSARRALLASDVEAAAIDIYEDLRDADTARYGQVAEFIEINDLIEQNVTGALNANYAFYMGLMDGSPLPGGLTERQVLAEVWSQEDEIRDNTVEWAFSYLLMAYQPLTDEDLDIYIALAETDEGRAFNHALFAAYNDVFVEISKNLGRAAGRFLMGQDI